MHLVSWLCSVLAFPVGAGICSLQFDALSLAVSLLPKMDVGMDLLFLHPRDGVTTLGQPIPDVTVNGRDFSQQWGRRSPLGVTAAMNENTIGLLMIPILVLLAAMRSSSLKKNRKITNFTKSQSSKKHITAVCGSVQGDGRSLCQASDRELVLRVPAGTEEKLQLHRDATFPNMSVVVEEGASLTLRESVDAGGRTQVYLQAGARLVHTLHQTRGDCSTVVRQDGGSKYNQTRLVVPDSDGATHTTDIEVNGPDCVSDVHSVHVVAREGVHTESDSNCNFLSTGTKARQTHRAVRQRKRHSSTIIIAFRCCVDQRVGAAGSPRSWSTRSHNRQMLTRSAKPCSWTALRG